MNLTQEQESAQRLIKDINEKCHEDSAFKSALLENPVATLESFMGKEINLPEGKELVVVDQTDDSKVYLNLNAKPNYDSMELTDEQLELVAGGEFIVGGVIIGVVAGAALLGGGIWVGTKL